MRAMLALELLNFGAIAAKEENVNNQKVIRRMI
jgi:hypothetical protein